MENRRAYYRHHFAPEQRIAVELESAATKHTVTGELIDLSLGGMQVRLDRSEVVTLPAGNRFTARSRFSRSNAMLSFPVAVVYSRSTHESLHCGLAFRHAANGQGDEDRERVLWRILFGEQVRALRQARLAAS